MSQQGLAEKLGVSKMAVSYWESGHAVPTEEYLIKLADIFGVSIDYFFDRNTDLASPLNISDLTPGEIHEVRLFIEFLKSKRS